MNYRRLPCYRHPWACLTNIFRRLWREQIFWTQALIVSALADLGDLPYIRQRLSRHARDFAGQLEMFYGKHNAAGLTRLLRDHFMLAEELIVAAKGGGPVYPVRNRWEANADLIAAFFSRLNPRRAWVWRSLLNKYLAVTEEMIGLRFSGQYAWAVDLSDDINMLSRLLADSQVKAICRRFYA